MKIALFKQDSKEGPCAESESLEVLEFLIKPNYEFSLRNSILGLKEYGYFIDFLNFIDFYDFYGYLQEIKQVL